MSETLRITTLEISHEVEQKLIQRHGVTVDEIVEVCEGSCRKRWTEDEERGLRLLVIGATARGRVLRVVLYPGRAPDEWAIATAFE